MRVTFQKVTLNLISGSNLHFRCLQRVVPAVPRYPGDVRWGRRVVEAVRVGLVAAVVPPAVVAVLGAVAGAQVAVGVHSVKLHADVVAQTVS